jgi:ubiquinone/menaquinone biosynthesis C-methylase UbiE
LRAATPSGKLPRTREARQGVEFDEQTSKALEFIYGTRDVLRRRALVHEALGAQPGESVLDVGCGPGFYMAEILERVGPAGRVAGLDTSAPMREMAARRLGSAENVELRDADATALPFDDGSFDAAVSVQVLEYVDDVDRAIAQLHRVLRPGGRVVLWDVDWETVSMHSADPERLERVLAAWDRHLVHRSLPQTLSRRLGEAGFTDVSLTGHSFTTTEFTPDAYGASLVGVIGSYLAGLDDFPDDEWIAWADEQRALGDAGHFYFACVQCCVTARRAS